MKSMSDKIWTSRATEWQVRIGESKTGIVKAKMTRRDRRLAGANWPRVKRSS